MFAILQKIVDGSGGLMKADGSDCTIIVVVAIEDRGGPSSTLTKLQHAF